MFDFDIDWKSAAIGAGAAVAVVGAAYGVYRLCSDDDDDDSDSSSDRDGYLPRSNIGNALNMENVSLMSEIGKSNMPIDMIRALLDEFHFKMNEHATKRAMVAAIMTSGNADLIAALKSKYKAWKKKEFASAETDTDASVTEEQKPKDKNPNSQEANK